MKYIYTPKGVCSQRFIFDIDGDTINSLTVEGGCPGNLSGISQLVKGMKVEKVIEALSGLTCGMKKTSCPDQISKGLEAYLKENA